MREPLKEGLVEWLLAGEPWAVYRTLTDLLDEDDREAFKVDNFSSLESSEENLQLMCGLSHSRSKSLNVIGARVVIAHKHRQAQT